MCIFRESSKSLVEIIHDLLTFTIAETVPITPEA